MSLIFIQCSKESHDVEVLKSVDKSVEQLVDITHSKIDKYNKLSMQLEQISFDVKFGTPDYNSMLTYLRPNGSKYIIAPISKDELYVSLLVSFIDISNKTKTLIIDQKNIHDPALEISGSLKRNLQTLLNFFTDDSRLSSRNLYINFDDLPEGCYQYVECPECPLGWGLQEIECPKPDPSDGGGTNGGTSGDPYGSNTEYPQGGGNGNNNSNGSLDFTNLDLLLALAAQTFILENGLLMTVNEFLAVPGVSNCFNITVDANGTITNLSIDTPCALNTLIDLLKVSYPDLDDIEENRDYIIAHQLFQKVKTNLDAGMNNVDEMNFMIQSGVGGLLSPEDLCFLIEASLFDEQGFVIIEKISWENSTDEERVNHYYKWVRFISRISICLLNKQPDVHFVNRNVPSDFFSDMENNLTYTVQNIPIKLIDGSQVTIHSFNQQSQDVSNNPNDDKVNVLGGSIYPPNNQISNFWGFIFPRGDSMSPNHEVLAFRASEEIIRVLENDFFGCQ